jgi:hypothetical protein
VAVFVSFSDEAGTGDAKGEFLVSGYVAEEREWPFVAGAWQERVLDGPPKIPYLHMTEIKNDGWRRKYEISQHDSQDRISEALKILSHSGGLSINTSIIKRSELTAILHSRYSRKKDVPLHLSEPDYFCFLAYSAFTVANVYRKYPCAEKVDFVVSRKQKVTHHINGAHDDVRKLLGAIEPRLQQMMGEIIPASMEERLPLQSADFLCWHQQRLYAGTSHPVDDERLTVLKNSADGYVQRWGPKELLSVAERMMPASRSLNLLP